MTDCNAQHPNKPLRCVAPVTENHPDHYAFPDVLWPNEGYVPLPPKLTKVQRKERAQVLVEKVRTYEKVKIRPKDDDKDVHLRRVSNAEDKTWVDAFDKCLAKLATNGVEFTSEDITDQVGLPPHHPNAVGARVSAAAKRGVITRVGFTEARRSNQHSTMIGLWRGQ